MNMDMVESMCSGCTISIVSRPSVGSRHEAWPRECLYVRIMKRIFDADQISQHSRKLGRRH